MLLENFIRSPVQIKIEGLERLSSKSLIKFNVTSKALVETETEPGCQNLMTRPQKSEVSTEFIGLRLLIPLLQFRLSLPTSPCSFTTKFPMTQSDRNFPKPHHKGPPRGQQRASFGQSGQYRKAVQKKIRLEMWAGS